MLLYRHVTPSSWSTIRSAVLLTQKRYTTASGGVGGPVNIAGNGGGAMAPLPPAPPVMVPELMMVMVVAVVAPPPRPAEMG
jgi:hypothetical protein